MKTAIDTNIISALWSICGPVYAELLAHPKVKASFVDEFLAAGRIAVDCTLDAGVWREAGLAFARYAARRRLTPRGEPKRLLVDYVIGAHASLRADRLLTFDKPRYVKDFPKLKIAAP